MKFTSVKILLLISLAFFILLSLGASFCTKREVESFETCAQQYDNITQYTNNKFNELSNRVDDLNADIIQRIDNKYNENNNMVNSQISNLEEEISGTHASQQSSVDNISNDITQLTQRISHLENDINTFQQLN